MPKKVAILQSNYIPWKGYFDLINSVDEFVLYDDVQYTKNDWRNRNKIKTPTGLQWLTIPVRQKNLSQKINETTVSGNNWNVKHWRTLQQHYGSAKFFKQYGEGFQELYRNMSAEENLSQINFAFITHICRLLGIKTRLSRSAEYEAGGGKSERLVAIVKALNGTEYVSGLAAKDYLDEAKFAEAGIKVTWFDYAGYPEYRQLYPPFAHHVSVLDLLFNEGPDAVKFMKSFNT